MIEVDRIVEIIGVITQSFWTDERREAEKRLLIRSLRAGLMIGINPDKNNRHLCQSGCEAMIASEESERYRRVTVAVNP